MSRFWVAHYTGMAGDAVAAQKLYRDLAADSERVLGPDESLARSARECVVLWSMMAEKTGRLPRLLQDARAGDEVSRMRLPAELRPLVDDERDA